MPDSLLTEYRNRFFESLSQILDDEQYFDVYILCKNEKMLGAHKVIMCSASSFFKSKFEYEAASAATNIVLMTDVDSIIMKIIIKFIYSGMLSITEEVVQDLLIAADFIGLSFIVSECCKFLRLNFDPTNIIGIHGLAKQMNCKILEENADNFRNLKFLEVIKNEEFVEMSSSSLMEYLSSSNLHVESEQQVFEAAIKWIMKDTSRRRHFTDVLDTIRIPLLSQKFLENFIENCQDKWLKIFLGRYISKASMPKGQQLSSVQRNVLSEKYVFRKCIKKMAYIVGGHIPEIWSDNSTLNTIVHFDSNQLKTTGQLGLQSAKLNEARSGHCTAVVDKKVFVFGGEDNSIMLNSVESWEEGDSGCCYLPSMTTPRVWASACSVANLIYIFGGLIDGATIEKRIDIFDSWTDTWQPPVSMPDNFNACYAMGVVFVDGLIYMVGGINQYSKTEDQCLAFNPVTETFDRICSLHEPRAKFGISELNNSIYVAGGVQEMPLTSVEKYSIDEDRWEYIAPLFLPRCGLGMVAMGGELFVLGGENTLSTLGHRSCSIESYKPEENTWVSLRCDLCQRKDFCMTVV